MINVVLIEPEIPPNTGNIGRLTLGLECELNIVGSPNFDLEADTAAKRAGLDYWSEVDLDRYESWSDYKNNTTGSYFLVTKFADVSYTEAHYNSDSHLIFGGENHGAPKTIHDDPRVERICIPMSDKIRAYNLANSAAIVLSEAVRQVRSDRFNQTPFNDKKR